MNDDLLISKEYFASLPHYISPAQQLQAECYNRVDLGSREAIAFYRSLGVDDRTIAAGAGIVGLCRVRYLADRSFEFDQTGLLSVVVEAIDIDGYTILDLVAWPMHRPDKFAPALHLAPALGIGNIDNPATYFAGRPLMMFRTPLAWLRAGCCGAVIVDPRFAGSWLTGELGPIAGEDLDHAREIARMLHPYVDPCRVLAPIGEAA